MFIFLLFTIFYLITFIILFHILKLFFDLFLVWPNNSFCRGNHHYHFNVLWLWCLLLRFNNLLVLLNYLLVTVGNKYFFKEVDVFAWKLVYFLDFSFLNFVFITQLKKSVFFSINWVYNKLLTVSHSSNLNWLFNFNNICFFVFDSMLIF